VPAYAVDGVIEINQARVKAGGGHFPFMITQPGSYRLTSNLDVTETAARMTGVAAENTTAIQVTADNVTIDLNGFMIIGPTVCTGFGSSISCTPTGSGIGIDAHGFLSNAAVMNGTVRGMGSDGVVLSFKDSQAEKIRALSNGGNGILGASVATGCTADQNGGGGIGAAAGVVANCTADNNGGIGIGAGNGTVANCTALGNGGVGISSTVATGCAAIGNAAPQISATGIVGHNICVGVATVACP
jgi:hypothetical protein